MPEPEPAAEVNKLYDTRPPEFSRSRRLQIPLIAAAATTILRGIGPTLRFESLGRQHYDQARAQGEPLIMAFWHRCIISATWYWRRRGIVVMNTTNFDGQWTRRVIERFGYGTAQGSSSRGGLRGLAVMAARLREGRDCAFTIDGPRGPRYVAKPGPLILARRSAKAIFVFHIGLERSHTFEKAWDLMQIPHLFSRAVMVGAPPIGISPGASPEELERKHAEMQCALERVRDVAESWFTLGEPERAKLRAEWNT